MTLRRPGRRVPTLAGSRPTWPSALTPPPRQLSRTGRHRSTHGAGAALPPQGRAPVPSWWQTGARGQGVGAPLRPPARALPAPGRALVAGSRRAPSPEPRSAGVLPPGAVGAERGPGGRRRARWGGSSGWDRERGLLGTKFSAGKDIVVGSQGVGTVSSPVSSSSLPAPWLSDGT